ncbi:hypothetical protein MBLNU459_g2221t1 [Dothideomycetes sp. NU459]
MGSQSPERVRAAHTNVHAFTLTTNTRSPAFIGRFCNLVLELVVTVVTIIANQFSSGITTEFTFQICFMCTEEFIFVSPLITDWFSSPRIKATLTDLYNCETVRQDARMRAWVATRLMDAEHDIKEQKRRRHSMDPEQADHIAESLRA